ncbi:TetR/AcrR family transcriptional regulator [Nocardioides sp. BP30]|uniref:TetR/AcrR family transcriptional regulator n=1 Tax=Nocardioides sp. BP30 TaxID=3036374 RepID=UPI002469AA9A|nr:TetR/AcrR family transcriptional regulator [Nocardioides sp. BP30]WGL54007.1 TetR/AcrR family transcriptional regulator [Nocardioides sp. BP30]
MSTPAAARTRDAVRRGIKRREEAASADVSRLVEAGRHLLAGDGPTRVADIVREAGVSIEAFYRYFGSKDEFVAAVAEDGGLRVAAYVERRMGEATTPEERMRAIVAGMLKQADGPQLRTSTRNILGRRGSEESHRSRNDFAHTMAALLLPVVRDLGSPDPERDAIAATGTLVAAMESFVWSEHSPTPQDVDHLTAFLIAAVTRADGSRPRP